MSSLTIISTNAIMPPRTMEKHIQEWIVKNSSTVSGHLQNFNFAWDLLLDWGEGSDNVSHTVEMAVRNAHDILIQMENLKKYVDDFNRLNTSPGNKKKGGGKDERDGKPSMEVEDAGQVEWEDGEADMSKI